MGGRQAEKQRAAPLACWRREEKAVNRTRILASCFAIALAMVTAYALYLEAVIWHLL